MSRKAVEIIKEYNTGRRPEILDLKYSIMAKDSFSFFRGTCHLFYQDLIQSGVKFRDPTQSWICGDLHLENFGVFKGENQLIYFDINDFDESTLAPITYDLSRFISSLYLSREFLGLFPKDLDDLAAHYLREFSETLVHGKAQVMEEPCATGIIQKYFKQIKARTKKTLLKEWMEDKSGKLRFKKTNSPILPLEEELKSSLLIQAAEFLAKYYPEKTNYQETGEPKKNTKETKKSEKDLRIRALDAGFRIAGTGSLGLNRFLVALELEGKIKFLDIKEAQSSSIHLYQNGPHWDSDSERICSIQTMLQGTPPALLSSWIFNNSHYVFRSIQPEIDKLNLLEIKAQKGKIKDIIGEMAVLTASAYIRSSGWKNSTNLDQLQAFGSNTDWQEEVIQYGKNYTLQVQKDFEDFQKAFKPKSSKTDPNRTKNTSKSAHTLTEKTPKAVNKTKPNKLIQDPKHPKNSKDSKDPKEPKNSIQKKVKNVDGHKSNS